MQQLTLNFNSKAKVIPMILPDQETRDFWHLTEDEPGEYAQRVARFAARMSDDSFQP